MGAKVVSPLASILAFAEVSRLNSCDYLQDYYTQTSPRLLFLHYKGKVEQIYLQPIDYTVEDHNCLIPL